MTAPRLSQGADEEIIQSEMRNKHVWVLDDKEGYLPGVVLAEESEFADVSVGFEVSACFSLFIALVLIATM